MPQYAYRCTHRHSHPSPFLPPRYLSAKDATYVNYVQFSDEVESIFTHKNLEKTPKAEVQQFVPPVEVDLNFLSPEEEQILQKTMHRVRRAEGEGRRRRRGEGGQGEGWEGRRKWCG